MSDSIVGTGINGKRLWMRDLNNTWVPVPTGAGENSTIRSVNVWDGHRWQVVTDPTPLYEGRSSIYHYPSLQMYAPGRAWDPGTTNPNYSGSNVHAQPWEPMAPDWLRLFHLARRVDPNWRIVQLYATYPQRTRSQERQAIGNRVPFFPRGGKFIENSYDQRNPDGNGFSGHYDSGVLPMSFQLVDSSFFEYWAQYSETRSIPDEFGTQGISTSYNINNVAGLLDLIAIRDRLTKDFPQRDPYFNRQYTSITKMTLKRVIIQGSFFVSGFGLGISPSLPSAQAHAYAQVGTAVTSFTDVSTATWPSGPYTVGRPSNSTVNSGIVLGSCAGFQQTESPPHSPSQPALVTGRFEEPVDYTFENPLEDNIGFFVNTSGVFPGGGTSQQNISADFIITHCALHYATQGHDVPAKYRSASDNGYPVAYETGG